MIAERGILLLVYGHPYYGRMAYNLACTLKANDPEIPVAVAHSGKALTHLGADQKAIFDAIIDISPSLAGGWAPKLHLYDLSPFNETLFLDADMAWLPFRTPTQLFDRLKDVEYTGITEGWFDYTAQEKYLETKASLENASEEDKPRFIEQLKVEESLMDKTNQMYYYWADLKEIKEVYKTTGKIYQWRTEVVYFKKTPTVRKMFEKAQKIHKNPRLKTIIKFGESTPDELAINISTNLSKLEPHQEKWTPVYWHRLYNNRVPMMNELQTWYAVGFGGNYAGGSLIKLHDQVVSYAMKKLNKQHVFTLHPKKDFLVERTKM